MNLRKYECDRCHKIGDASEFKEVRYITGLFEFEHYKDLCGNCCKDLHKFMQMKIK